MRVSAVAGALSCPFCSCSPAAQKRGFQVFCQHPREEAQGTGVEYKDCTQEAGIVSEGRHFGAGLPALGVWTARVGEWNICSSNGVLHWWLDLQTREADTSRQHRLQQQVPVSGGKGVLLYGSLSSRKADKGSATCNSRQGPRPDLRSGAARWCAPPAGWTQGLPPAGLAAGRCCLQKPRPAAACPAGRSASLQSGYSSRCRHVHNEVAALTLHNASVSVGANMQNNYLTKL